MFQRLDEAKKQAQSTLLHVSKTGNEFAPEATDRLTSCSPGGNDGVTGRNGLPELGASHRLSISAPGQLCSHIITPVALRLGHLSEGRRRAVN